MDAVERDLPRTAALPRPHPLLRALFAALEGNHLEWCVVRGEDQLHEPSGDVDLLLARRDLAQLRRIASEAGFISLPAWGHGSHRFLTAYSEADARWIKLDVVVDMAFGPHQELTTDLAETCLSRRRRVGDIHLLAVADAFWTLTLHCWLDKRRVSDLHRARLRQLAPHAGTEGPLPRLIEALTSTAVACTDALEYVRAGDWDGFLQAGLALERSWRRRQPSAAARRLVHRGLRKARHVGLPPRPGLMVALLAPDGAGKSTAATHLARRWPMPVEQVYMGLYGAQGGGRGAPSSLPGLGFSSRLLRQWRRYVTARWHRARGHLVICDRYSYDALLPQDGRPRSTPKRVRRWLLGHSCPPPDAVLVLDAPGATLHERKGEHDPEVLERQRQGYLELALRRGDWYVINAAGCADMVQRSVTSVVWRNFRSRAEGR